MTAFAIPATVPTPCDARAPDLWTVACELGHGHAGAHRNNQVIWNDPQLDDVTRDTDHWVDGQVVLTDEKEPVV